MKLGFIGAGNMTSAILLGISKTNIINKEDIFVSNRTSKKLDVIKEKFGYNTSTDNAFVIKNARDVIVLSVKPQVFDNISEDIKKSLDGTELIVSIMAGKSLDYLQNELGTKNVIRVMPNTPCLVGAGISAVAGSIDGLKNKNYSDVISILKTLGEVIEVDEKYIDAITQVSGASPAFVFMMIEALADGGVNCGLPRDMAYKFATNAVYGSGKLATVKYNEDKTQPGVLKDMVTSPGGTTIEGVRVLEKCGFRGAIIDAVLAAYKKSKNL